MVHRDQRIERYIVTYKCKTLVIDKKMFLEQLVTTAFVRVDLFRTNVHTNLQNLIKYARTDKCNDYQSSDWLFFKLMITTQMYLQTE